MKLKSTQNTESRGAEVIAAFLASNYGNTHPEALPVFEHGQWFINCGPCGAQWSVVDASGGSSVDGFDFEEITEGDESCLDLSADYSDWPVPAEEES